MFKINNLQSVSRTLAVKNSERVNVREDASFANVDRQIFLKPKVFAPRFQGAAGRNLIATFLSEKPWRSGYFSVLDPLHSSVVRLPIHKKEKVRALLFSSR